MKNLIKFSFIITSFLFASCGEPQTAENFSKQVGSILIESSDSFDAFFDFYEKKGTPEMEAILNEVNNMITEDKAIKSRHKTIKYVFIILKNDLDDIKIYNGGEKLYESVRKIIELDIRIFGESVDEAVKNYYNMSDKENNNFVELYEKFSYEFDLFNKRNNIYQNLKKEE